jgi:hypothetical protein
VPVEQVRVELARTDYPKGWGSGGCTTGAPFSACRPAAARNQS